MVQTNKVGYVLKDFGPIEREKIDCMSLINQYSRKELTEDDVYIFPVTLCNNEIDRDTERFTLESLNAMAPMFVGVTGITNHEWDSQNQNSRIFYTSVNAVPGKITKTGEPFYELNALCYTLRNKKNESFIEEIEAGIKKEVSVGCSMGKSTCSICGEDYYNSPTCAHHKGNVYEGKTCYVSLEQPLDAYEYSFVAVPAQIGAGVVKAYDKKDPKNKDGEVNNMFAYDEKLKEFGIDEETFKGFNVDAETVSKIAKASQPTIKEGIAAEGLLEFISKDAVTAVVGSEKTSEEVLEMLKQFNQTKEDADKYKNLFNKSVDDALKEGVKAKGENFDESRWRKILCGLSYEEVKDQAEEWNGEAAKIFNAGGRVSEPYGAAGIKKQFDDTDLNF